MTDTASACMRSVLARFDTDLATARERAVAWAEGDVDALRAGARGATRDACLDSFADTMQVAAKARDLRWQRLVEAGESHAVSLAAIDIRKFMSPEEFSASLDDAMTLRADFGGSPGPSLG